MSNVFSFVADITGHKNVNVSASSIPLTNVTGNIPGPLSTYTIISSLPQTSSRSLPSVSCRHFSFPFLSIPSLLFSHSFSLTRVFFLRVQSQSICRSRILHPIHSAKRQRFRCGRRSRLPSTRVESLDATRDVASAGQLDGIEPRGSFGWRGQFVFVGKWEWLVGRFQPFWVGDFGGFEKCARWWNWVGFGRVGNIVVDVLRVCVFLECTSIL